MLLSLFHLLLCRCHVHIFPFTTTALVTGPFSYSLTLRLSSTTPFHSPCLSTTILHYERSTAPLRPVAPSRETNLSRPSKQAQTLSLAARWFPSTPN